MTTRLDDAIVFAAQIHRGQRRKGDGLPYVTHPIRVMEMLARLGVTDEDTLIAAILHDTLEDTPAFHRDARRMETEQFFGQPVCIYVEELSFLSDLPHGPERKAAKTAYLASFKGKSFQACLVKLADRFDNLTAEPANPAAYAKDAKVLLDATKHFLGRTPAFDAVHRQVAEWCEYPEAHA